MYYDMDLDTRGSRKYMRCKFCERKLFNGTNGNSVCRDERLCRDCGNICEIRIPQLYRYYYTTADGRKSWYV